MSLTLRYSRQAGERFLSTVDNLRQRDLASAKRWVAAVEAKLQRLLNFPQLGYVAPLFPTQGIREFIVEPYRFYYIVDAKTRTLWVVDCWHTSRMPEAPQLPVF